MCCLLQWLQITIKTKNLVSKHCEHITSGQGGYVTAFVLCLSMDFTGLFRKCWSWAKEEAFNLMMFWFKMWWSKPRGLQPTTLYNVLLPPILILHTMLQFYSNRLKCSMCLYDNWISVWKHLLLLLCVEKKKLCLVMQNVFWVYWCFRSVYLFCIYMIHLGSKVLIVQKKHLFKWIKMLVLMSLAPYIKYCYSMVLMWTKKSKKCYLSAYAINAVKSV